MKPPEGICTAILVLELILTMPVSTVLSGKLLGNDVMNEHNNNNNNNNNSFIDIVLK